ncbi:MAG: hypothetical protein WC717_05310 [Candidatus Micrarchaeia archaeon]|jgi:hypothetical protein
MAIKEAKTGQAAMEYLVTYGWALLALFVVVAYLIATGAFSANSFAAQECVLQPDLPCSPFVLYADGGASTLKFSLTNGLGFPILVENITYTATNLGQDGKQQYPGAVPSPNILKPGDKMNFTHDFTGPTQPGVNDFRTVYLEMYYYKCRGADCSGGPYATSGRIAAVVQQK